MFVAISTRNRISTAPFGLNKKARTDSLLQLEYFLDFG